MWGEGIELSRGSSLATDGEKRLDDAEVGQLAQRMTQFVNRAQQKYLAGEQTLKESVKRRLADKKLEFRERLFIELGMECYRRYHWYLLNDKARGRLGEKFDEYGADFNLIVLWASKLILDRKGEIRGLLEKKQYILIDEYQDFSRLFLSVVLAIREVVPEVKLFAVGDDWQAINRFAGSDVEYFKEFERYFPEGSRRLVISTNYRCDRAVVEAARKFMQKSMREKGDFRAYSKRIGRVVVVNPEMTSLEYGLVDYNKRVRKHDRVHNTAARRMVGRIPKLATVQYLKTIIQVMQREKRAESIMILHRNNNISLGDVGLARLSNALRWDLEQLGVMGANEYDAKVKVITMHKAKGLEAEVVIILEADEGVIPKIHPDATIFGIFGENIEMTLADQKRLFYVAMTRAKKRLYIIHKNDNEGFVKYLGRGIEGWGE